MYTEKFRAYNKHLVTLNPTIIGLINDHRSVAMTLL